METEEIIEERDIVESILEETTIKKTVTARVIIEKAATTIIQEARKGMQLQVMTIEAVATWETETETDSYLEDS